MNPSDTEKKEITTSLKTALYSKNEDKRNAVHRGMAIAIAKKSGGRLVRIKRIIDSLASMFLIESTKLEALALKHADYVRSTFSSVHDQKYASTASDIIGFGYFYSSDDIEDMNENIDEVRTGYQYILDVTDVE